MIKPREIGSALLAAVVLMAWCCAGFAGSPQGYRFERYFPPIQQPWFFGSVDKIAADRTGLIVLSATLAQELQLLTLNGQFTTQIQTPRRIEALYARNGRIYTLDDGPTHLPQVRVYDQGGALLEVITLADGTAVRIDVAVDSLGRIFVLDSGLNRVWRYNPDGSLFGSWGGNGTGLGLFDTPVAIDLIDDGQGNTEVLVADVELALVQRFSAAGGFIEQWGEFGSADGQFFGIKDLAMTADGRAVIIQNNGVQVFQAAGGQFLPPRIPQALGTYNDDQFWLPLLVAVDSLERIIALEQSPLGGRGLKLFDFDGELLTRWNSYGTTTGELLGPRSIAAGPGGTLYVADQFPALITVFSNNGAELDRFVPGGAFPTDLHVNPVGEIFVTTGGGLSGVTKLDAMGNVLTGWGSQGSAPGQFQDPFGITGHRDGMGNAYLYVADTGNRRVQRFDENGVFQLEWGGLGSGPGQFGSGIFQTDGVRAIAVSDDGVVYVGDPSNNRVQSFDLDGNYLDEFSTAAAGAAVKLDVDSAGRIYVAHYFGSDLVRIYDSAFNDLGTLFPGPSGPFTFGNLYHDVAVAPDDRIAYLDDSLPRVRVYRDVGPPTADRAIVVAGGGPFPGNTLWPATQVNANFGVRVLNYQGFTRNEIHYLTPDLQLDLDQNGLADDVDADATNANLMEAILGPTGDGLTGFAADAERLFVYLVDHGGLESFRMNGSETLDAATFAGWLTTWQQAHPGVPVYVIYDACQAGSFLQALSGASDRVVVTSARGDENAYFVSQGALSFSNLFWIQIFNGLSLGNAFGVAEAATTNAFAQQHPQIDADGSGTFEPADQQAVIDTFIGNGTVNGGADAPVIASVSPPQMISGTNSASLVAFGVVDDNGIGRVWAILRPPGFNPGSPDNPVQDLPTVELERIGASDDFEAVYQSFAEVGTYSVAIYAADVVGNTSVPGITSVTVDNPLTRRAVVVAGGAFSDPDQPRYQTAGQIALRALEQQGYGPDFSACSDSSCDDIQFLVDAGIPGADGTPEESNVVDAIVRWGVDPDMDGQPEVQDLTIYLAADHDGSGLRLSATESLTGAELDGLLDQVQMLLPGTLTVVLDADDAGSLLSALGSTAPGSPRILIASAANGSEAVFADGGDIGFARFFWGQVLNGASVRPAFELARQALAFAGPGPMPELDDDGNGVPNELLDGLLANRYAIGSGVLLAGDDPLIGSVAPPGFVTSTGFDLFVDQVTSTGTVSQVIAILSFTDGSQILEPLAPEGGGRWSVNPPSLTPTTETVEIAIFARDDDGNTSLPALTSATGDVIFLSDFELPD